MAEQTFFTRDEISELVIKNRVGNPDFNAEDYIRNLVKNGAILEGYGDTVPSPEVATGFTQQGQAIPASQPRAAVTEATPISELTGGKRETTPAQAREQLVSAKEKELAALPEPTFLGIGLGKEDPRKRAEQIIKSKEALEEQARKLESGELEGAPAGEQALARFAVGQDQAVQGLRDLAAAISPDEYLPEEERGLDDVQRFEKGYVGLSDAILGSGGVVASPLPFLPDVAEKPLEWVGEKLGGLGSGGVRALIELTGGDPDSDVALAAQDLGGLAAQIFGFKKGAEVAPKVLKPVTTKVKELKAPLSEFAARGKTEISSELAQMQRARRGSQAKKTAEKIGKAEEVVKSETFQILKPKKGEVLSPEDAPRATKALEGRSSEISEGLKGSPKDQFKKASSNVQEIINKNKEATDAIISRPSSKPIPRSRPLELIEEQLAKEEASLRPNEKRIKMMKELVAEEEALIKGKSDTTKAAEMREIKRKIDEDIDFDGKRFDQLRDSEKLQQQKLKIARDAYRQTLQEYLPEKFEGRTFSEIDAETAALLDLNKVFNEEFRRVAVKGEATVAEKLQGAFNSKLGGATGKGLATVGGFAAGGPLGAGIALAVESLIARSAKKSGSLASKIKRIEKAADAIKDLSPEKAKATIDSM